PPGKNSPRAAPEFAPGASTGPASARLPGNSAARPANRTKGGRMATNRWMMALGLATLALGCEGADLNGPATPLEHGPLQITQATAQGFDGTIVIAGETVTLHAEASGTDRVLVVKGAGATPYADWNRIAATDEILGSFAGQAFGNDPDVDMNTAVWAPIA